ncbi:hypothetical protein HK100_004908 [Physocladia obscura]|uniref:Carboxylesterase type B domain-containing protein n=1 Tax=Physocladia obscura TaxID=109957 RepID=A0AAD5SUU2_9FUNG|nr:hypothetical protein HK100_004908 [Physocladia obscura]
MVSHSKLSTKQGSTTGNVTTFLGIPYAAAPVGNRRFKPPQPPNTLSGITLATSYSSSCIPATGTGSGLSEDCLYLNVFVPSDASLTKSYPVVVWVYGGSFISGSANSAEYNGTSLITALPSKAIVVTFNYRLAYFGFLASSDLKEEGSLNAGLLDQAAVFDWTRQYIGAFGGNSSRITAWGQSAGARKLIVTAILESGATNIGTGTVAKFQNYYNTLAQNLGCDSTETLYCLRNASTNIFAIAASNLPKLYLPVIDGTYFPKSPFLTAISGGTQKIPMIMMYNTNEGTIFAANGSTQSVIDSFMQEQFFFLNTTGIIEAESLYPASNYKKTTFMSSEFQALADTYGDANYKCPIQLTAMATIKSNSSTPIYRARFNIIPSSSAAKQDLGVYHGAELPYVWNYTALLTSSDTLASSALISAYSSFIATSVPLTGVAGVIWPKFNLAGEVLVIDLNMTGQLETMTSDFLNKCAFWEAVATIYDSNPTTSGSLFGMQECIKYAIYASIFLGIFWI